MAGWGKDTFNVRLTHTHCHFYRSQWLNTGTCLQLALTLTGLGMVPRVNSGWGLAGAGFQSALCLQAE